MFDQIPRASEPDVGELRSLSDAVITYSRAFGAGVLTGEMDTEVVRITTEMANAASSIAARAVRRVDETRAWKSSGALSAGHHQARVTGGSAAELNKAVATKRRIEDLPRLATKVVARASSTWVPMASGR